MLIHRSVSLVIAILIPLTASSAAAQTNMASAKDDPLPAGAIARLGTPRPEDDHAVAEFAVAPDGRMIALVFSNGTIELWDKSTRARRTTFSHQLRGYPSVAFSAAGKTLTAIGSWGNNAIVWDTATATTVSCSQPDRDVGTTRGLMPDGRGVLWTGRDSVHIIDAITGKERIRFAAGLVTNTWPDRGAVFAPEGRRCAVIDASAEAGAFHVLAPLHERANPDNPWKSVPVDPQLCAAPVAQWDAVTGAALPRLERAADRLLQLTYAPDGRTVAGLSYMRADNGAAFGSTIHCWEAASGKLCQRIEATGPLLTCVAIAPDGRRLVAGSTEGTLVIWDLATGKRIATRRGHRGHICSVRCAPDGKALYSAGADGTVLIWDMSQIRVPAMSVGATLDRCIADLALSDAAKVFRAVWVLADAPTIAVPLLRRRFSCPHRPMTRRCAAGSPISTATITTPGTVPTSISPRLAGSSPPRRRNCCVGTSRWNCAAASSSCSRCAAPHCPLPTCGRYKRLS